MRRVVVAVMLVVVCTEGAWAQTLKVKNEQKTPQAESVGIKQTAENKRLRNELVSLKENDRLLAELVSFNAKPTTAVSAQAFPANR